MLSNSVMYKCVDLGKPLSRNVKYDPSKIAIKNNNVAFKGNNKNQGLGVFLAMGIFITAISGLVGCVKEMAEEQPQTNQSVVDPSSKPATPSAGSENVKSPVVNSSSKIDSKVAEQIKDINKRIEQKSKQGLDLCAMISEVCDKYNGRKDIKHKVDKYLILPTMYWESNGFDPKAVSPANACGLMQLMPDIAKKYFGLTFSHKVVKGKDVYSGTIFDPKKNIKAGVDHFGWGLQESNGDIIAALAKYDGGSAEAKWDETREYIKVIPDMYNAIKENPELVSKFIKSKLGKIK